MIKSFKSKETEKIFNRNYSLKFPPSIQKAALRKLLMIDAATTLEDLRVPPANNLEKLKGNRQGRYSIRINDKWRVCFKWKQKDVYEIEIINYHN
jgi:proteic killer suppression protein